MLKEVEELLEKLKKEIAASGDKRLSPNFRLSEFACKCGCGYANPHPELVRRLQGLRGDIGRPVVILSGCRCKAHNLSVGGRPQSYHLFGWAADIIVPNMELEKLAKLCRERFDGVGVYYQKKYVHVDVRGYPARWSH